MDMVFFDFDGVILDSVSIKTRAFGELFEHYGESVRRQVIDYHLSHGGVSRFEKFRYYYREILRQKVNEEAIGKLGEQFTELTLEMVLSAPFIDGAEATLDALMDAGVPAVVCSGTPQEELERIVEARNLGGYFVEVHGSPRKKPEIVEDVCSRHSLNPADCLFIGDALTDLKAARTAGMPFLGVNSEDSADFPEGTSVVETLSLDALRQAASKSGPQAKEE